MKIKQLRITNVNDGGIGMDDNKNELYELDRIALMIFKDSEDEYLNLFEQSYLSSVNLATNNDSTITLDEYLNLSK